MSAASVVELKRNILVNNTPFVWERYGLFGIDCLCFVYIYFIIYMCMHIYIYIYIYIYVYGWDAKDR